MFRIISIRISDTNLGGVIFRLCLLSEQNIIFASRMSRSISGFKVMELNIMDKQSGIKSRVTTEFRHKEGTIQG